MNFDEISKHNKRGDLYVVIHNKVYDVTAFLSEHPGGEEVLVGEGGGDATESFEDIGHSEDARQVLEKYYIGDLDEKSARTTTKAKPPPPPTTLHTPSGNAGSNYSTVTGVVVPLLVLVLSIVGVKYLYAP